jgi:hypothetical protein
MWYVSLFQLEKLAVARNTIEVGHGITFKDTMVLAMMVMMLMEWDYACELWPPKDWLLIPQVIYKNEEPCWNDIDRGKHLIHKSELSGNPTICHLVAKQEEVAKEIMNLA